MNLFKLIEAMGENLMLSHISETNLLVKILSVSTYLNREVTNNEIEEAYKILRVHFEKLGVEDDEISLIKKKFDEAISKYQDDKSSFVAAKRELFKDLKESEHRDYYLSLIVSVLESDGVDNIEREWLIDLKNSIY